MIQLTALLVVFNLAGLPAASAVCLAWCGSRPATTSHCHDEESPAIARIDGACAVLNEQPYLWQGPRHSFGIACGPSPFAATPSFQHACEQHLSSNRTATRPWSTPFVLRL